MQIVQPSQNKNGIYLRTAGIQPGHGWVNLYASATPPPGPGDIDTPIIFAGNGSARAGERSQVLLQYPLFIPSGLGLWVSSGSFLDGAAADGAFFATWDLLS